MRVFAWALDSWKTPLGKVISVILSIALIFSCSNAFLASSRAYAAGATEGTEAVDGDSSPDSENSGEPENGNGTTFADDVDDADDLDDPTANEESVGEDEPTVPQKVKAGKPGTTQFSNLDPVLQGYLNKYGLAESNIVYYDINDNNPTVNHQGGQGGPAHKFEALENGNLISTTVLNDNAGKLKIEQKDLYGNGRIVILNTTRDKAVELIVITVSFADFAKYAVTYDWGTNAPEGVTLPSDSNEYKTGDKYRVDTTYSATSKVNTYDNLGNINGTWTFSGWTDPNNGVMGEANVVITGMWTYVGEAVAKWNITYAWTGDVPQGVTLPTDGKDYINNESYTVDTTFTDETVIKVEDAFGNVTERYTFSGWDTEDGKITSDLTISGEWTKETPAVAKWNITYAWTGDVPQGVTLPTDGKDYINNESYTVDTTFTDETVIKVEDAFGNVTERYTFSGWDTEDGKITSDLTISGEWTSEVVPVAVNNVVYAWTGLPQGVTLYDAAGNVVVPTVPGSITGLVNNQPYTIDAYMPGTVVYTQDAAGNQTASYTLGDWTDPNNGIMGTQNVTVSAAWMGVTIPVPPTPVTPPTPTPTPVTPVTPAPAPATPATPATVATIDDNPTPMAENAQDVIEDDAVPMGAFDEPECWVHILMIIGIILTMVYGVAVVARRLGYKREIDKMDKDLTASEHRESSASHSRGQVQGA